MDAAPTSKERAGLYNQKNRIYFGAYTTLEGKGEAHPEYLEEAVQALEKAIKLNDREPSYYYNLATCLRKRGDLDGAVTAISKCMELDSNDDDHLKLAYELYREKKRPQSGPCAAEAAGGQSPIWRLCCGVKGKRIGKRQRTTRGGSVGTVPGLFFASAESA